MHREILCATCVNAFWVAKEKTLQTFSSSSDAGMLGELGADSRQEENIYLIFKLFLFPYIWAIPAYTNQGCWVP